MGESKLEIAFVFSSIGDLVCDKVIAWVGDVLISVCSENCRAVNDTSDLSDD